MAKRGVPKALLITSLLMDVALLLFFLFMPRSGMEAMAFTFVALPLTLIRAVTAVGCAYLCLRRRAWGFGLYTAFAVAVVGWLWVVGLNLEPSWEPLHEVLRQKAREGATTAEQSVRTLAYDRRRARQTRDDADHGGLCDLMAVDRDLRALREHPLQEPNRPCTTFRGAEVSPLLHAVTHSYGVWSGGAIPHPPIDEAWLAPAAEILLAAGADPDLQDEFGNSALHYALIFRNEALLDVLLAAEACVLLPNSLGESPLATHSSHGLRRKIEAAGNDPAALSRCPDALHPVPPDAPASDPGPAELAPDAALLRALRSGRLELAMELLQQGADPDARDYEGSSFEAALRNCRDNSLTMAQLLLDAGADVDRGNQRGHTALRVAFDHCRSALPFLLERGADPTVPDRRGDVLLHYLPSVREESVEALLDQLLGAGAEIDQQNQSGQSPLLRAVYRPAERLAVALLERGADPELADRGGNAPLHVLARRPTAPGTATMLRALLAHGADLERPDGQGETPLAVAARHGDVATLRLLVDAGADVNARRPRGTPLIGGLISCEEEKVAKLESLLAAGADPSARTEHGPLPLAQAFFNHVYLDCLRPAELLLAAGADPNLRDRNGGAPIHSLAYWTEKDPDAALALLKSHGAAIDLRNDQGLTTLLLSARGGSSVRTMERLLNHGADFDARDERDNTLLHYLAENRKEGIEARITWALERGADTQARNDRGETPLERARRLRNGAAIAVLEKP